MEDILGNLTEEQRCTLKQFQLNLEELLTPDHTDYNLVKYLRAKNFDIKAAEKIFKDNYYNRITYGINTILDTYEKPEVVKKYEAAGVIGFAKDGSLIRYALGGRLDFYGFIMSMSCYELCLYFSYMMESDIKMLNDQRQKTGNNVHEITYIMDLETFTIQQVLHKSVIEMGLDFVRLFQDCYPEIWSRVLIVNAPKIFDKAFNLFRPVLRDAALRKIRMADKGSTKDLLLKYIDEDVLPAFLGGKRVDSNGDPECKEFITFGGKVPEKMYSHNSRIPLSSTDPDVKCFNIGPRSVRNICTVIRAAGTRLKFQLRSENGSIYVTLLYKEFGLDSSDLELPEEDEYLDDTADKYKQLSVELRCQAHCTQENATITVQWPGMYIVRLSNAGSWFTSRRIMVKYELFPPEQASAS